MSAIFFEQMDIAEPRYHLGVGSLSHATQTAKMMEALEVVMQEERADWVLVYGDTNSTLAGAVTFSFVALGYSFVGTPNIEGTPKLWASMFSF